MNDKEYKRLSALIEIIENEVKYSMATDIYCAYMLGKFDEQIKNSALNFDIGGTEYLELWDRSEKIYNVIKNKRK